MLKKTIIGFMLALFAVPLAAHAELPGQICQKTQVGTTKMADDKQNIIACLETGNAQQAYEWKSMTSGGGGGITGGCKASNAGDGRYIVSEVWGKGCSAGLVDPARGASSHQGAVTGYTCGTVQEWEGNRYWVCIKM